MSDERTEEKLPDELKAVETALRGLTPATGAVDRDRLMYLAGRASVLADEPSSVSGATGGLSTRAGRDTASTAGRASSGTQRLARISRFAWPLATAALVLLSLTLSGRLLYISGRSERILVVQKASQRDELPVATASVVGFQSAPSGGFSYMQLRNAVLNRGVDALPAQAVSHPASAPNTNAPHWPSLRDDLLGS